MVLASITQSILDAVSRHGGEAVFVLMALDALLPVGGELVMLYAGVLAAGAVTGHSPSVLGVTLATGLEGYVVMALVGAVGYLVGAIAGWQIGRAGGRGFIDRHGRWLHITPERFRRAERWFARFGPLAVLLGRVTPVVRSFISIPAGVLESPLLPYIGLTLVGSAVWCFGFAGAGWAVGGNWQSIHDAFRYADYAAVAGVAAVAAVLVIRRRRHS